MRRLRAALPILFVVAACGGSASTPTTTPVTAPTSPVSSTTLPETPSEPHDVAFTAGGNVLEATLWPGGRTWVVLGHMRPADKDSWSEFAELAHRDGYSVLTYNNRGYGNSEGPREPYALYADAAAAIAFAQENGASRIVYGGASMNAANAIALGAFYEFSAIIALSVVPTFPSAENALGAAYEVYEPTLFVASEDDGSAVSDMDEFLDRISAGANWIVLPSGGHGTDMLVADPTLGPRILDWLRTIIG